MEDLQLQTYLLTGQAPPALREVFEKQAGHLSFTDQLYHRDGTQWLPYPSRGLRTLLMEEAHIANHHVGGEKLYHVLCRSHYWPTMRKDCSSFVGKCFECQLSSGKAHGSWQG